MLPLPLVEEEEGVTRPEAEASWGEEDREPEDPPATAWACPFPLMWMAEEPDPEGGEADRPGMSKADEVDEEGVRGEGEDPEG